MSPLTIAALEKNVTLAQLLLQHGANPQLPTKEGSTAYSIMPSLKRLTGNASIHMPQDGKRAVANSSVRHLN